MSGSSNTFGQLLRSWQHLLPTLQEDREIHLSEQVAPLLQLAITLCQAAIAWVDLKAGGVVAPFPGQALLSPAQYHALVEWAATRKAEEIVLISDLRQAATRLPGFSMTGESSIRFYASVPIRQPGGELVGALVVAHLQPGTLQPFQQEGLLQIAEQLGTYLYLNAQIGTLMDLSKISQHHVETLYESNVQLFRTNQVLRHNIHHLEQVCQETILLNRLCRTLMSCQTYEEAAKYLRIALKALFPNHSGGVFGFDGENLRVEAIATWGAANEPDSFPVEACLALQTAEPQIGVQPRCCNLCLHQSQDSLKGNESMTYCCIPLKRRSRILGLLRLCGTASQFPFTTQKLASKTAKHIALGLEQLQRQQLLLHQSIQDPLTKLFNRRYLMQALEPLLQRASRNPIPVSMIMMDIDHFKRFNDVFGHLAGDAILRDLGLFLRGFVRSTDIACRFGGEEFAIVLLETSSDIAQQRAELLRRSVQYFTMKYREQHLGSITLSMGVATFPEHGRTALELLEASDRALYVAKQQGRDRVVVAE